MNKKPQALLERQLPLALAIGLSLTPLTWAQVVQSPSPAAPQTAEDKIELSPFVVSTKKDQGYFAENTLAGSRMSTNVADLASSISVVTKQQMEDTGSVDLNDVFRYEINTEGSSTYTPSVQSLRSDGIVDVNAGVSVAGGAAQTNASANRVRGLGSPTTTINYFTSAKALPMDSYNVESLEISRGPNSMLFGMGSPAGIVNISTADAVINRNSNRVTMRFDDRESVRASFSFNRSLIEDKLAIYGAFLYNDQQFERKPSYDISRRQYGAITARPFQKTTIRANVEHYDNRNRRPNTLTPRDFVTEWVNAGRPTYDSSTRTVKLADGTVKGIYVNDATSPFAGDVRAFIQGLPNFDASKWNAANNTYNGVSIFGDSAITNVNSILYVPGFNYANKARTIMQISNGQLANWFQPLGEQRYLTSYNTTTVNQTVAGIMADPAQAAAYNAYYAEFSGWSGAVGLSGINNYMYPGVSDRSIYDYRNINANQMNFGSAKATTYNVSLDQEILPNLHLNAGWFKQDYSSISNYTVAQLNAATLYVDMNEKLPDGSANPFVGQVYMADQDADQGLSGERNESSRVMLAYTPDFTRNNGWTRFLGRHQLLGLWSNEETMSSFERRRLHYTGADTDAGAYRYLRNPNTAGWNPKTTALRRYFYLSNPGDPSGAVSTSSGEWNHNDYSGSIRVFNYETGQYENLGMSTGFITRDESTARSIRKIEAFSAGLTSYLWNERLITTLGVRRDDFRARTTTIGAIKGTNGNPDMPALTNSELWVDGVYQTHTAMNRWNNWSEVSGNTSTMGAVLKPFKGWDNVERRANNSLFWEIVRDFGFSYNKSDNFNAPAGATTDLFGNALPKPTGEGKDYGFQFSAFNNKLFARVTWFDASNENEQIGGGTAIDRLRNHMDTTAFRNWAYTIAKINMGFDPRDSGSWDRTLTTNEEAALETATSAIWELPYNYYRDVTSNTAATRTAEAKGIEMQVTYNPTRNWTMKFTGGKQETVYTKVLGEFNAWYDHRRPIWENAKAANYLNDPSMASYTMHNGRQVDLSNFLTAYGFDGSIHLDQADGQTNVTNFYNILVAPQVTFAKDLEGQTVPGQRKYRGSYLTNYNFDRGVLKGWSVGGSQRWEDKAIIGYYGKASGANGTALDISDVDRPIFDSANWYTDIWVGYTRRILSDKVRMKLQLNVNNVFEDGGLRTVAVNFDGSPAAYRIIDSRQFSLTASFDF